MIEVTTTRAGTLTDVVAICPSDDLANRVEQIFQNCTSRYSSYSGRNGLVVKVSCKRIEAERIASEVERLSYRSAPTVATPEPINSGTDIHGKHRELIQATWVSERDARNPIFRNGRNWEFSGFGEEFIGREIHGHLWGERVRYAYYIPAVR
jgi:hypothetical protein